MGLESCAGGIDSLYQKSMAQPSDPDRFFVTFCCIVYCYVLYYNIKLLKSPRCSKKPAIGMKARKGLLFSFER